MHSYITNYIGASLTLTFETWEETGCLVEGDILLYHGLIFKYPLIIFTELFEHQPIFSVLTHFDSREACSSLKHVRLWHPRPRLAVERICGWQHVAFTQWLKPHPTKTVKSSRTNDQHKVSVLYVWVGVDTRKLFDLPHWYIALAGILVDCDVNIRRHVPRDDVESSLRLAVHVCTVVEVALTQNNIINLFHFCYDDIAKSICFETRLFLFIIWAGSNL